MVLPELESESLDESEESKSDELVEELEDEEGGEGYFVMCLVCLLLSALVVPIFVAVRGESSLRIYPICLLFLQCSPPLAVRGESSAR